MVDESGLAGLRSALEADGYTLEVRERGDRLDASLTAAPGACADCLVPKPVFRAMLERALGVPVASIDLRYPGE